MLQDNNAWALCKFTDAVAVLSLKLVAFSEQGYFFRLNTISVTETSVFQNVAYWLLSLILCSNWAPKTFYLCLSAVICQGRPHHLATISVTVELFCIIFYYEVASWVIPARTTDDDSILLCFALFVRVHIGIDPIMWCCMLSIFRLNCSLGEHVTIWTIAAHYARWESLRKRLRKCLVMLWSQ